MKKRKTCIFPILSTLLVASAAQAQAVLSGAGTVTQDFDVLPASGSPAAWTNDTTVPGWFAARESGAAFTQILVSDGASTTGGLFSYGTTGSGERALGSLCSGTTGAIAYGTAFRNDSGEALHLDSVSYRGEQWRNAGTAVATLSVWYQVGNDVADLTPGNDNGWTRIDALTFTGPSSLGSASKLNGNDAAYNALLASLTGVAIDAGSTITLRWLDTNDAGNDHGLAIDDFSASFSTVSPVPEPASAGLLGFAVLGCLVLRRRRRGF